MSQQGRVSPSLFQALLPILVLLVLLASNVIMFGDGGLSGPNQLALLFSAAIAMVIGLVNGKRFNELMDAVTSSITTGLPALLILLLIGALAGTWLISGVVPAMIYYGLKVLSPSIFLFAACIVCCVVSLATGSSWSTVATVGIALLAIGKALGFHDGLVAGAIISGAYFGDKLSPLSDTTNLAPAVAGTDLFTHIRYMMLTTVPSITLALIAFIAIGLFSDTGVEVVGIDAMLEAIDGKFHISLWLFLVPAAVVFMIVKRVAALPALFIGTLAGALVAVVAQPDVLRSVFDGPHSSAAMLYAGLIKVMGEGASITTGNAAVDELLSSGGMAGMLNTIWLIICAMTFGGAMEGAGSLQRLTREVMKLVHGEGSLIATTAASCLFVNATASDQYLAIVVPGRMFADAYKEEGLDPKVLSRTLEDSGTVTSPLIPWNTCGAYHAGVLGVATMTYLPFCFFNIISPIMTVVQGAIGFRIARLVKKNGVT